MKSIKNIFAKFFIRGFVVVFAFGLILVPVISHSANVVQRPAAVAAERNRLAVNATRPSMRMPSVQTTTTTTVTEPVEEIAEEPAPVIVPITAKDSQFSNLFESVSSGAATDELAARIRAQRQSIEAADIAAVAASANATTIASGSNACDDALRSCMAAECGNDFSKCAGDGDTVWGGKMESCRRKSNCTGQEFASLAAEIKADRDVNAILSSFQETMQCGEKYNECILSACGTNYTKCLSKSGGDAAISKCSRGFEACRETDSGLQARAMELFATLRTITERDVNVAEKRLLEIRNLMMAECNRTGAAFDERSLECVYTVNFAADKDGELTTFASRKLAAGSEFMCTPEWFGIDITTFKENAYRYTRNLTGASNAVLGAGIGMAAGAASSGMLDRAMDRHSADKAAKAEANKPVNPNENNDLSDSVSAGSTIPQTQQSPSGPMSAEARAATEKIENSDAMKEIDNARKERANVPLQGPKAPPIQNSVPAGAKPPSAGGAGGSGGGSERKK